MKSHWRKFEFDKDNRKSVCFLYANKKMLQKLHFIVNHQCAIYRTNEDFLAK